MIASTPEQLKRIDRTVTAFLDEWTARTKRRHVVGDSLSRLEHIVEANGRTYASLTMRLGDLTGWLDQHGDVVVDRGVHRTELEVLVNAAERLVQLRASGPVSDAEQTQLENLVDRLVGLIRRGTAELGLEYTPAGLMESPTSGRQESQRARRSLLERLQGFEDVKEAYTQALDFQKDRLAYFYQEDTHLLSVLDYQLKNLEARPNPDDELFAACLIYFLRMHNYQVAPYLARFRKVVGVSAELWEEPAT
jgi:hypothetical protein